MAAPPLELALGRGSCSDGALRQGDHGVNYLAEVLDVQRWDVAAEHEPFGLLRRLGEELLRCFREHLAVFLALAIGVFGVAWFRIATAALIFAPVTRPDRMWRRAGWPERRLLIALSVCLAVTKCSFYLALDWLPLARPTHADADVAAAGGQHPPLLLCGGGAGPAEAEARGFATLR